MKKLLTLLFLIISFNALAANNPLEIIQPQPGLTTTNRFYKAYPGIEYNVKVAVIGGAYPFTYSLTQFPPGMIISSTTGVISWPNPVGFTMACGGGIICPVTAKVVDAEGSVQTVQWTVSVTTTGFIFVATNGSHSSCNGGSATGTISNPFLTIGDWYCGTTQPSYADTTYQGYFVYYRAGTYQPDGYHDCPNNSCSMLLKGLRKPMIHMAYPGESVTFDMTLGGWTFLDQESNMYIEGIHFINNSPNPPFTCHNTILFTGPGNLAHTGDNKTIRLNNFDGFPAKQSSGCNPSATMFGEGDNGSQPGFSYYNSVTENTYQNLLTSYGALYYSCYHCLFADNTLNNMYDPLNGTDPGSGLTRGIGLKVCNQFFSVRNNLFNHIGTSTYFDSTAIESLYNSNYNGFSCIQNGTDFTSNIDISFNKIENTYGIPIVINAGFDNNGGPVWIYRNSASRLQSGTTNTVVIDGATSTNGPFYVYNNATAGDTNATPDHIICNSCPIPSRMIKGSNIAALNSDAIFDSNWNFVSHTPCGNLPNNCTSYVGSYGAQINANTVSPPTNVHGQ